MEEFNDRALRGVDKLMEESVKAELLMEETSGLMVKLDPGVLVALEVPLAPKGRGVGGRPRRKA